MRLASRRDFRFVFLIPGICGSFWVGCHEFQLLGKGAISQRELVLQALRAPPARYPAHPCPSPVPRRRRRPPRSRCSASVRFQRTFNADVRTPAAPTASRCRKGSDHLLRWNKSSPIPSTQPRGRPSPKLHTYYLLSARWGSALQTPDQTQDTGCRGRTPGTEASPSDSGRVPSTFRGRAPCVSKHPHNPWSTRGRKAHPGAPQPAFQPGLRPAPAVRPWPRKLALLCPGFPSSKTG